MRSEAALAAFEVWASARLASLLRFGFAITHDEGAAEDLVEHALVRTALARRDLIASGEAERYARHAMVAEQQRSWRRPRRRAGVTAARSDPSAAALAPDDAPAAADLAVTVGDGDTDDIELSERDRVWRELVDLPPRQRAVLVLRCYEDRARADVAACTVDAVERDELDAIAALGVRPLEPAPRVAAIGGP